MKILKLSESIGDDTDLAEDFYANASKFGVEYTDTTNTTFKCIRWEGKIPLGTGHNGSKSNYYYCSEIHDTSIGKDSTDAQIKASVKKWINLQEWNEKSAELGFKEGEKE